MISQKTVLFVRSKIKGNVERIDAFVAGEFGIRIGGEESNGHDGFLRTRAQRMNSLELGVILVNWTLDRFDDVRMIEVHIF